MLNVTIKPASGSTIVFDGKVSRSIKAVAWVDLTGDAERRTFTSTDTDGKVSTYKLMSFTLYADGSVWAWAAQLTRKGDPYKNGYGLTMANLDDMARLYGQDVRDVIGEALDKVETERRLDELAARGQAILDAKGQTVDEYWAANQEAAEAVPTELPEGAILAGRNLIGTASGLTMRDTNTLVDALDVMERHPMLARVLAGIILAS